MKIKTDRQSIMLTLIVLLLTGNYSLYGQVQWNGNGHYYDVVTTEVRLTWDEAAADAETKGGYLVTLTSIDESNFVFDNLVNDPNVWVNNDAPFENQLIGPWIGASQPDGSTEPLGGWQWTNNDGSLQSTFQNWELNEPNDFGIGENRACFFNNSFPAITNDWNDVSDKTLIPSYVIEFDILLGDVNLDGLVNLLDIDPFVIVLSSGRFQAEADTNQDGVVNLLDVEIFVSILSGG